MRGWMGGWVQLEPAAVWLGAGDDVSAPTLRGSDQTQKYCSEHCTFLKKNFTLHPSSVVVTVRLKMASREILGCRFTSSAPELTALVHRHRFTFRLLIHLNRVLNSGPML